MTTLTFSPNWIHTPAGFAPTGNTGRLSVSPDVRLSAPERAVADQLLADLDSYPLTVADLDGVYRAAVASHEADHYHDHMVMRGSRDALGIGPRVGLKQLRGAHGSVGLGWKYQVEPMNRRFDVDPSAALDWLNGRQHTSPTPADSGSWGWTCAVHRDPPMLIGTNMLQLMLARPVWGDEKAKLADRFQSEGNPFVMGSATGACFLADLIDTSLRVGFWLKWKAMRPRPLEVSLAVAKLLSPEVELNQDQLDLVRAFREGSTYKQYANVFGYDAPLFQRYPESHPAHPATPAGHACVGEAIYQAITNIFDMPAEEAGLLHDWTDNFGRGRIYGGIHYWSDVTFGKHVAESVVSVVKARHELP